MTVGELLRQASSRELSEWIEFYGLQQEHRLRDGLEKRATSLNQRKPRTWRRAGQ